jgi:hypothetical protein
MVYRKKSLLGCGKKILNHNVTAKDATSAGMVTLGGFAMIRRRIIWLSSSVGNVLSVSVAARHTQ